MFKRLYFFEFLVLSLTLFISACQPKPQMQRAFYHWQTNLSLSPDEQNQRQRGLVLRR